MCKCNKEVMIFFANGYSRGRSHTEMVWAVY